MNAALRKRRSTQQGFTLLEVMLALGIFMLVAVSLAVALNQVLDVAIGVRRADQLRLHIATRLAEGRLDHLSAGTEILPPDADGTTYERVVEALAFRNAKGQAVPNLYRIRITARRNAAEQQTAEVYVYQP